MNVIPRILILTASYGNGHLLASQALLHQFQKQGVGHVTSVDLMKEGHPFLNTITTSLYKKSTQISRIGFDYYGWTYYLTRDVEHNALFNRSMNILGRKKLMKVIEQERPDAVVNTFPFGASPEVCSSLGIRNFTVLTDYALHSRWIHPKVDKYYVATEELKQQIISKGFSRDQVEVSGIPIRKQFDDLLSDSKTLLEKPKEKTILIMAGDHGISNYLEEMVHSLLAMGSYKLLVICGRNEKLKHRLDALYPLHLNLNVFGYVENIHEIMSISSCIVTKAGGLTLTEAISLRIPIFIFKPYAGQERENALFLSEYGVASISNNVEELTAQIQVLLKNQLLHEEIKNRMDVLERKKAAATIVNDIIHTIQKSISLSM
jgi:processive 1,2-diacylglycerol beta-glucosyltransferase